MWGLFVAALAWTSSGVRTLPPTHTYVVDATLCDTYTGGWESIAQTVFEWEPRTCEELRVLVRRSFSAWEHNHAAVTFRETTSLVGATMLLHAGRVTSEDTLAAVMYDSRGAPPIRVLFNADQCWYSSSTRVACHFFRTQVVLASVLVALLALSAAGAAFLFATVRLPCEILLAWTLLLPFSVMLPCTQCQDLEHVTMHEAGHVLGLSHAEEDLAACGCGGAARNCTDADKFASIMTSYVYPSRTVCLSTDDVDGMRTLHGGVCEDPTWCHDTERDGGGVRRVAIAGLYAVLLATLFRWAIILRASVSARARPDPFEVPSRARPAGPSRARPTGPSRVRPTGPSRVRPAALPPIPTSSRNER